VAIAPHLRVRLAAFRTLTRARTLNQTIEPTTIAGFNQFFDDFNGTSAWQYSAALDVKLTDSLFSGISYSYRDLKGPVFVLGGGAGEEASETEQDEDMGLAYLYWTPSDRWALRTELGYERFNQNPPEDLPDLPVRRRLETWSVPTSAAYFHPSGLFGKITGTWVHQEVENPQPFFTEGDDSFVILDAAVGYRLPKRRGILSLEARNVLDEGFKFQDVNFRTLEPVRPRYTPARTILARLTLNF
jgi:hypothetical protein